MIGRLASLSSAVAAALLRDEYQQRRALDGTALEDLRASWEAGDHLEEPSRYLCRDWRGRQWLAGCDVYLRSALCRQEPKPASAISSPELPPKTVRVMDKDRVAGSAKDFAGKVEGVVGGIAGDAGTQAAGRAREGR